MSYPDPVPRADPGLEAYPGWHPVGAPSAPGRMHLWVGDTWHTEGPDRPYSLRVWTGTAWETVLLMGPDFP